ncbi:MAG TPA: hypothetical protein VFY84_14165 [Jiangellales bacterium]|nr:hypothetical protein [Jiangellales bacterium]
MIPAPLAEWLGRMTRVERIRVLSTLTDRGTVGELSRMRRAEIAAEIAERGYGGRKSLAEDLGIVRMATISEAVAQHRMESVGNPTENSTS